MKIVGVIKRMKHGHFPWRSLLMFASRELSFLTFPLAKKTLQLLRRVSLKVYLPRVQQGPASDSGWHLREKSTPCTAHTTRSITKTSNMSSDERLRLDAEVAALTKLSHDTALCNTNGDTMLQTFTVSRPEELWGLKQLYFLNVKEFIVNCKPTGCLLKRGRLLMWQ